MPSHSWFVRHRKEEGRGKREGGRGREEGGREGEGGGREAGRGALKVAVLGRINSCMC